MATLTQTGAGTVGHMASNAVPKAYAQSIVIDGTSTALTSGDVIKQLTYQLILLYQVQESM